MLFSCLWASVSSKSRASWDFRQWAHNSVQDSYLDVDVVLILILELMLTLMLATSRALSSANKLARHFFSSQVSSPIFFFSIIASTPLEAILKTVWLISLYILRRCVDPPAHRRSKPQNSWLGLMFVVRTSTTLFEEPMFSHLLLTGEDASEQANQWFNQLWFCDL